MELDDKRLSDTESRAQESQREVPVCFSLPFFPRPPSASSPLLQQVFSKRVNSNLTLEQINRSSGSKCRHQPSLSDRACIRKSTCNLNNSRQSQVRVTGDSSNAFQNPPSPNPVLEPLVFVVDDPTLKINLDGFNFSASLVVVQARAFLSRLVRQLISTFIPITVKALQQVKMGSV